MVRRARPPHSRKQEPPALGRWRRASVRPVLPYTTMSLTPPCPAWVAPGSPGVPIVARRAELAVGALSVVLAEAEPAEVVAVASAWVPMPVALAGPAAA